MCLSFTCVFIVLYMYAWLYVYVYIEKSVAPISVIISGWGDNGRFLFLTFAFLYFLKNLNRSINCFKHQKSKDNFL